MCKPQDPPWLRYDRNVPTCSTAQVSWFDLWVGGHLALFCIHQVNRMNSCSDSAMVTVPKSIIPLVIFVFINVVIVVVTLRMLCVPVSRGHLDGPCLVLSSFGDLCVETGLYCDSGLCRCRPDHFTRNDSCGKQHITLHTHDLKHSNVLLFSHLVTYV